MVVKSFALPCGSNGDCDLVASIRDEVALERSFQCMRLIHRDGDISTRKLAERMNISNGAAYYVLKALIEKGYVKAENFKNNPKKSGYLYLLTPDGLREKSRLTADFIQRKRAEYDALERELHVLEQERDEIDV